MALSYSASARALGLGLKFFSRNYHKKNIQLINKYVRIGGILLVINPGNHDRRTCSRHLERYRKLPIIWLLKVLQ